MIESRGNGNIELSHFSPTIFASHGVLIRARLPQRKNVESFMKINPSKSSIRRQAGFTLLEMVIVLGIIGIILGGIGYKMIGSLESAKIKRVDGDFKSLDSALSLYKLNAGYFPTQNQGLKALVSKPSGTPVPRAWVQQLRDVPMDPWGNPYSYRFPGKKRANEYELISKGPDGMENTADDISSQDE